MEVSTRKFTVEKFYMEDIDQMLPKSQFVEEFEPSQNDPVNGTRNFVYVSASHCCFETSEYPLQAFSYSQSQIICQLIAKFDEDEQSESKKGSVLVFLPGFAEINQVDRDLKHKKSGDYEIYRVHSTLTTHKNNQELDKVRFFNTFSNLK